MLGTGRTNLKTASARVSKICRKVGMKVGMKVGSKVGFTKVKARYLGRYKLTRKSSVVT